MVFLKFFYLLQKLGEGGLTLLNFPKLVMANKVEFKPSRFTVLSFIEMKLFAEHF